MGIIIEIQQDMSRLTVELNSFHLGDLESLTPVESIPRGANSHNHDLTLGKYHLCCQITLEILYLYRPYIYSVIQYINHMVSRLKLELIS